MTKVALTGATGFIGGAIAASVLESGRSLRTLVRGRPRRGVDKAAEVVAGGLQDRAALSRFVDGVDVVIHAASYVGPNPTTQHEVNVGGTASLLAAVRDAGVRRLLYVSTSGVYGAGLRNGAREDQLTPAPRSSLSVSRRAAELLVLDHAGIVIRPHMVTGVGDRWFLPPYLALTLRLGAWVNGGRTRVSVIDRATLAAAVTSLLDHPHEHGIFHAAYPEPIPLFDLALPVLDAAGKTSPTTEVPEDQAMEYAVAHHIPPSQMAIAARDNFLNPSRLWATVGRLPATQRTLAPDDISWYARQVPS